MRIHLCFQRFPQVVDMYSELKAYLYFSPVAPLTTLGQPPGKVHYVELRMSRSGQYVSTECHPLNSAFALFPVKYVERNPLGVANYSLFTWDGTFELGTSLILVSCAKWAMQMLFNERKILMFVVSCSYASSRCRKSSRRKKMAAIER